MNAGRTRATAAAPGRWEDFRVTKALPVPLYHQIYTYLRDRIFDGTFAAGGPFPSESQLENELKVSRITARRALAELAARGLITRAQGRPSRVSPYKPATRLVAGVEGMIETSHRMADATTVQLLDHEYVPASAEVGQRLALKRGARVLWTVRVRSLDGVPFSYAVTYLPDAVAHTIHAEKMSSRALIELLEQAGIVLSHAEQTISAIAATAAVARALHIEAGAALLLSERVVYDQHERPVEFIAAQYRPDIYQYRVALRRTRSSQGNGWSSRSRATPSGPRK